MGWGWSKQLLALAVAGAGCARAGLEVEGGGGEGERRGREERVRALYAPAGEREPGSGEEACRAVWREVVVGAGRTMRQ